MKDIYIYREHLNYCCASREVFTFSKMQKNGIPSEDMTLIIGFFLFFFLLRYYKHLESSD